MKKILIILGVFICAVGYSQTFQDYFSARLYMKSPEYRLGDSIVTVIYGDTLVNPDWVRVYVANNSPAASLDTIYVSGQNEWVGNNDTIYKVDSSNYSDTCLYALNATLDSTFVLITATKKMVTDTLEANIVLTDTATVNNYLDVNGNSDLNGVLFTGSTQTPGAFYTGSSTPTSTANRLNYDGMFYTRYIRLESNAPSSTTNLMSVTKGTGTNYAIWGRSENTGSSLFGQVVGGVADGLTIQMGGSSGVTSTGRGIYMYRETGSPLSIDFTGNLIEINDNPNTTGTISGKVLTATIGNTERIKLHPRAETTDTAYVFDTDSIIASGAVLSIRNKGEEVFRVDSNGVSIGGGDVLTSSDTISLKDAVEAEQFAEFNFDTATKAYLDGTLHYNAGKKALNFYNDISGFSHQLGYELVKRVYNNSGATISNGKIVRRTGTHTNDDRVPTIALAGNSTLDSTNICGMATVDIPNNSYGIVLIIGNAEGLNTSSLAEDDFYLGHAGDLIDTSPPPPYVSVRLGCNLYSDNDSGLVAFNPREPAYNPSPLFSSDTSGLNESVTITTQNVYEYLPLSNNAIDQNIGYTIVGDSVQIGVDGYYQIVLSLSFQGNPTSETWHYGIFVNDVLEHKKTRTTSSSNSGDTNVPISRQLAKNDWVSFRIRNTSGTGDPTVVDMAAQILFLHL